MRKIEEIKLKRQRAKEALAKADEAKKAVENQVKDFEQEYREFIAMLKAKMNGK